MIEIESIQRVLTNAGIMYTMHHHDSEMFDRIIRFDACGNKCEIEWFANTGYLTIGTRFGSYVSFTDVRIDTTWPAFRKGIKFISGGDVVCRLAVELLPWQLEVCNGL